jgi:hypothetical protein
MEALPKLGEFIEKLGAMGVSLSKLSLSDVGVMALALTALAAFVYGLGKALQQFNVEMVKALPNLGQFLDRLGAFGILLSKMKLSEVGVMSLALAALAAFIYGLGLALRGLTADIINAMPKLGEFLDRLGAFGISLSKLKAGDVAVMAVALAVLAGFIYVLGLALQGFNVQMINALPKLGEFLDRLGAFGVELSKLKVGDVAVMAFGLAALAGFVYVLGLALQQFSQQALAAMPGLAAFMNSLANLGQTMASLSVGDLIGMAFGLGILAGFVYVLGMALGTFSADVLQALPALAQLFDSMNNLATSMAHLSIGELLMMGAAFALIAGFVWALALALVEAAGPLASLATIFSNLKGVLGAVGGLLSGLGGLVGDVLGGIGDVLGGIGDLAGDVVDGVGSVIGGIGGLVEDAVGGIGDVITAPIDFIGDALFGQAAPPPGAPGGAGPDLTALASTGGAGGPVDQSVNLQGGISVTINADKLEADSATLLSDQIIQQIQAKLGSLRSEQGFRTGDRTEATA